MNFLIIYSRGKWVADVFLGNFPRWSLFNLRARFLLFGNEKSQKLNLNNLKSKRPLAVRENEAVWQKTRKTVSVCLLLCVCVCASAGMCDVRAWCWQHRFCVFDRVQFCMCMTLYKHHFVHISTVWLEALWDRLYDCLCTSHAYGCTCVFCIGPS